MRGPLGRPFSQASAGSKNPRQVNCARLLHGGSYWRACPGLVTTRLTRAVRSRRFNFQQLSGHPQLDGQRVATDCNRIRTAATEASIGAARARPPSALSMQRSIYGERVMDLLRDTLPGAPTHHPRHHRITTTPPVPGRHSEGCLLPATGASHTPLQIP